MKKVLVTGTAGFIGFHLANLLTENGYEVTGLDNINDYYDQKLKYDRLEEAGIARNDIEYGKKASSSVNSGYEFIKLNLEDSEGLEALFREKNFEIVINLAAQAGVRYSLSHPEAYIKSNIDGFLNILESCRRFPVENLLYASSSSVYGLNKSMPFSVTSNVDHPVSLYAASKKSNELMAHSYSHLFDIASIGLRFFTVYGPWGRPDMALFIFTKAILAEEPIDVFNYGRMERDFTYIDDIVKGIFKLIDSPPTGNSKWDPADPDPSSSSAPFRIYNIGNNSPVKLLDFIAAIEKETGRKAIMKMKPIQPGDVEKTWADVSSLEKEIGYRPNTSIENGVKSFVAWYRSYYNI